ncbi:MAG: antibiotic biosynthesis monooxygenase [Candidatus Limnocylindrales bacterium]
MSQRAWTTADLAPTPGAPELVVIQARVPTGQLAAFEAWLRDYNGAVQQAHGHLDYDLTKPTPGFDEDSVLVHRFSDRATAAAWVGSAAHRELVERVRVLAAGDVDVHLYTSDPRRRGVVSALFTTRVDPGREAEFLAWSTRVAEAQASFEGFISYQVEPPIAGVQDDWIAILSYDTDAHMRAWLSSPQRAALLAEESSFDERARVHIVRNELDAWFNTGGEGQAAPAWKRNMLVLLVLYPVVFLTAAWVQEPLLSGNGLPFWLALFVANIISVVALGWLLVPAAHRVFGWWLYPRGRTKSVATVVGVAVVVVLYGISLALTRWISSWPWP